MKNLISTGVLAIVLTSSSMAGMSINSIETNMSNYTKEMTKTPYTDHVLLARSCGCGSHDEGKVHIFSEE
ncbi:MAG: hypothetical protein VX835_04065 [Pseudomonadota bacterium]|nr:hypothetical protein [Pseudomonadota bacterium]